MLVNCLNGTTLIDHTRTAGARSCSSGQGRNLFSSLPMRRLFSFGENSKTIAGKQELTAPCLETKESNFHRDLFLKRRRSHGHAGPTNGYTPTSTHEKLNPQIQDIASSKRVGVRADSLRKTSSSYWKNVRRVSDNVAGG